MAGFEGIGLTVFEHLRPRHGVRWRMNEYRAVSSQRWGHAGESFIRQDRMAKDNCDRSTRINHRRSTTAKAASNGIGFEGNASVILSSPLA